MSARWTKRAQGHLFAVGDYIATDDPVAADRWIAKLSERADRAARVPNAGRNIPEFAREDVREVFVRSYRIMYRIDRRSIVVFCVLEGHQQVPDEIDPDES